MSYLVLARKYRPQSFEDLVGQEHVAKTLANAIASNRVAHAFLFTGVRGVGKTTSARLLAKCLNCLGADGKATGPTAIPCQVCAACKEIASGSDMDVQEIDGASYNGVDEVRHLQQTLAFQPARDRYKVYIVDEVHMLSVNAWNAFLKTLEEPPPHVKFIFATTEVHKVPGTILSRCQRYDFKLITTQMIAQRLAEVLSKESIAAEETAINVLAREAAGSMRDAMSLLDQVIAFSGEKLAADDVTRVLGVANRKVLHQLASGLVGGDASSVLAILDDLAQQGFDMPHLAKDILRHLRDLVVAKVSGEDGRKMLELADEEVKDVLELAKASDADDLTRLYQGFSKGFDEMVRSGQVRIALEMLLVRLARRPPLLPLDELLSRLGDLERRLSGAAPPPPRGGGGAGGGGARAPQTSSHGAGSAPAFPGGGGRASSAAPERGQRSEGGQRSQEGTMAVGALALARPAAFEMPAMPEHLRNPEPAAMPVAKATAPSAPPKPLKNDSAILDPDAQATWRAILARVRDIRRPLASVLEHAVPLAMNAERVVLGYDQSQAFLGAQASEAEALDLLTREVRAHFGAATQVALDLTTTRSLVGMTTIASVELEKRRAEIAKARGAVERNPLVAEIIQLFGAELRDVRLPGGDE